MSVLRVVHSGMATWTEIHENWTLDQVWDAVIFLDMKIDAEILAMPEPKK